MTFFPLLPLLLSVWSISLLVLVAHQAPPLKVPSDRLTSRKFSWGFESFLPPVNPLLLLRLLRSLASHPFWTNPDSQRCLPLGILLHLTLPTVSQPRTLPMLNFHQHLQLPRRMPPPPPERFVLAGDSPSASVATSDCWCYGGYYLAILYLRHLGSYLFSFWECWLVCWGYQLCTGKPSESLVSW